MLELHERFGATTAYALESLSSPGDRGGYPPGSLVYLRRMDQPDVVLYEEGLEEDVLAAAVGYLRRADMLIVAGTSLTVYPAAGLVRYFRGKNLVLINRDATPMDSLARLVIREKVGEYFLRIQVHPLPDTSDASQ